MAKETIPCENCGERTIEVVEIPGGHVVRRGFTGKRGKQYYKSSVKYLTKNCPKCGAYHGQKQRKTRDTAERLRKLGLPTVIKEEL